MNCSTCNNQLQHHKVSHPMRGAMGKTTTTIETYCPYCEWKGNAGPGLQLKEIIRHERLQSTGVSED